MIIIVVNFVFIFERHDLISTQTAPTHHCGVAKYLYAHCGQTIGPFVESHFSLPLWSFSDISDLPLPFLSCHFPPLYFPFFESIHPLHSLSSTRTPCSPCFLRTFAPPQTPNPFYPDPACCLNLLYLILYLLRYKPIWLSHLIVFYFRLLCIFFVYSYSCIFSPSIAFSLYPSISSFSPTSVWPMSDFWLTPVSDNRPEIIGHTC